MGNDPFFEGITQHKALAKKKLKIIFWCVIQWVLWGEKMKKRQGIFAFMKCSPFLQKIIFHVKT
jgi:hypothetical protein